jgi:hypothetical protein
MGAKFKELLMRNEKNLRRLCRVAMILALCAPGFSEDQIVASQWAAAPVKIDGQPGDWDTQALNSDKKTNVDYAFRNDAQNLYVLVVFKDPRFLSSINLTGMTIWFDSGMNKKKDFAITFINRPISADQYIAMLEEKKGPLSEDQKAQVRTNERYMYYDHELTNKKSKEAPAKFSEKQDPKIPVFRNSAQEKTAVYEFIVPLNRLAELSAEIGADPGKTIQVCFEWGGATRRMKEAVAAQIGSEGARAKTEGATGELTTERDSGGSLGGLESQSESLAAMRRRLPKQYSFWATVSLAQGQ